MNEPCKHDGMRHAQRQVLGGRELKVENMEWCVDCGTLLDISSIPIPLPVDSQPNKDKLPA